MKKQIIVLACSLVLINSNFLRSNVPERKNLTSCFADVVIGDFATLEHFGVEFDQIKRSMEYVEWVARDGDKRVIKLETPMLALIDGKSFGINGVVFGLVLQVRKEVRGILYGQSMANGERQGLYVLDGKHYSVISLARLEYQYDFEYYFAKNELIKNRSDYGEADWQAQMENVETLYKTRKAALKKVLEKAKDEFLKITNSYVESARGVKEQTYYLIKESCDKRGRDDCIILQWGEAEEGKEGEILKNQVVTFKHFTQFCYDLANFLEDMARSCKEGQKQFRQMISAAKKRKK